jgi:hypothetical protein
MLSPSQEAAFQQWKAINAPNDSGQDYDLRGAFLANEGRAGNGHMIDQFKMPNHHSFSNESQYATPDAPHWNAQDQLVDKYGNIVFDERNMPRNIGEGGQSLGMTFRDPTAGIIEADPFEMATGMPLTDGNENYDQLTRTALGGVQGMAIPAYLQEGYQGPQTGMGPVADFAAGLGQVFQGGSGAGSMGAPALLASQAVNNAADAGHALGTMGGGGKVTRALEGTASMGGTAATHTAMDAAEVEKMARAAARAHLADVGGDHAKAISGLEQVAAMAESDPRVSRRLPVINRTIELLRGKTSVAPTPQEAVALADEAAQAARDTRAIEATGGGLSDAQGEKLSNSLSNILRGSKSTTMGTMGGQPRPRGLGNKLSELMAGGTEAERAALAKRLTAEAGQAKPITAYHGSPEKGLTELTPGYKEPGVWFTSSINYANDYAKGPGGQIYEADLSLKKPMVVTFDENMNPIVDRKILTDKNGDPLTDNVSIVKLAERNPKYDGVHFPDGNFSEDSEAFVVFHPSQINLKGGQSSPVPRDQALANLIDQPARRPR